MGGFKSKESSADLLGGPFVGKDKWLGGVLAPNNIIYGVPGNADRVLKIVPSTGKCTLIGPVFKGHLKWLRGEVGADGMVYCVPCCADTILKINPETDEVTTVGGPWPGRFKWHGGVRAKNGAIYCIPAHSEAVLKIDPLAEEGKRYTTFGGPFPGEAKWYGGLMGPETGKIYGAPQCAGSVIVIDPEKDEAYTIGELPDGGHKFHGGVVNPVDSSVYCVPCNSDYVLRISDRTGKVEKVGDGTVVKSGTHRSDGKYKYLGGANGPDGCTYFFPSDAEYVLRVVPERNGDSPRVETVGRNLSDNKYSQNKWQNGFCAPDGCVYGIPLKSESVLKIDTITGEVSTFGGPFIGLNKWEGGVESGDCLFCMPMKSHQVLKISPGPPRKYVAPQSKTAVPKESTAPPER